MSRKWAAVVSAWRARLLVVVLILLALVLRATNLTAQSLWADEGNSVRVTDRSLPLVIDAARADVHPPGYYLLLWAWVRGFGQSETAVRALSVVVGVALVGVVYLVGTDLWNPRVGWLGALCAALSPLQVQYSQEVRMYILVAFLAALATYVLGRWLRAFASQQRSSLGWSLAYVVVCAAGLWSHYSFPLVIGALGLAWAWWWLGLGTESGKARAVLWWVGAHAAMLVLYLPWLPVAWDRITAYGAISAPHPLRFVVTQWLKLLSVGETVAEDDLTRWLAFGLVGLSLLGAWAGFAGAGERPDRRRRRVMTLSFVALAVSPMLMMSALTLVGRSAYRPKFFLVASPSYSLLVGTGIEFLGRAAGTQRRVTSRLGLFLGLVLVAAASARSLWSYYLDPTYARSDYRGISAYISAVARERDAVLLNAPNQWEVFTYYYPDGIPVYPLPRTRPPLESEVVGELALIATRHDRLYAVLWAVEESDPQRIVERWLSSNTYKAAETWYGDVRLAVYGTQGEGVAGAMARQASSAQFGDEIALRAYAIGPRETHPGDLVRIELLWEALEQPARRYKVFVHLVDPNGQIAAQVDREPGGGMGQTSTWAPADGTFTDRYGLLVPLDAGDGLYSIVVGLYDLSGAPRLPLTVDGKPAGDALVLGTLTVGPAN